MTIARISVVACALLFAFAPGAHAQQWGGSPPAANPPMVSSLVYAVPVVVIGQTPYYYATYDYNDYANFYARYYRRHASNHEQRQQHGDQQHGYQQYGDIGSRSGNGGSWDGSRPQGGGSPAVRPIDPVPVSRESFGYVAPRAEAASAPVVAPRRTRDVYRERFGRP